MSAQYVKDMTEGNETRLLISFSIPMVIGNVFQQFYNMVDSIIVGNFVGANALAAVGATGSLNFLFFSLCGGMSMGVGILISQYFGARNEENVRKTIANSIYIITAMSILMSVLGIAFSKTILQLLNTPPAILDDSAAYMRITCAGILAIGGYNGISAILRALGDSRTPLIFLIVASLLNVVLDLLFVIQFGLGVRGVGYATIIAQAISAIGSIIFALVKNPYFRIKKEHLKFNPQIASTCMKLGLPIAAQSSLIAVSCVALQSVVNQFGAGVVAAFTATSRIEQLVQQPYNSLGAAVSTFTGQNMGANRLDRVKRGFRKSVIMVVIFSVAMLLLIYTNNRAIISLFVKEESVIAIGAKAIRITSLMFIPLGLIYVTRGLLNGAGDAFYSVINGAVEIIGRIGFSNALILIPTIGQWGVWWATGLTWVIVAVASLIRYRQGIWKTKAVSKRQGAEIPIEETPLEETPIEETSVEETPVLQYMSK